MLSDIYFLPLQGRLTGLGGEDLPTVVIVAHYDSFGVAPVSILFFLKPSLPSVPFYFSPLNLYFLLLLKTNSSFKVEHRDVFTLKAVLEHKNHCCHCLCPTLSCSGCLMVLTPMAVVSQCYWN